ncbi:hypothetical protein [uncultured Amphritea sp.]|uniref:hypothetical protein n=1 Tax=uncultured Amphritea sp. TaxID=981605 RepID=UPI0026387A67|nr:hypothetical protein [uncultured Amphritea sp.]
MSSQCQKTVTPLTLLMVIFLCATLCGCSEQTDNTNNREKTNNTLTLFDETQPFDPDSLSMSITVRDNLDNPQIIEDISVELLTEGGAFILLQQAYLLVNGVRLSRWDQSRAWYGQKTYYTGDDIPINEEGIDVSLVLPGRPPVSLAHFDHPPHVNLQGIHWPDRLLKDQSLTVSWEGIQPLDQISVAESTLAADELFSGSLTPWHIKAKGSIDLLKPLMKAHNRHIEISGRKPLSARLTYAKVEFSTQLPGEILNGIQHSEAMLELYVNRESRAAE